MGSLRLRFRSDESVAMSGEFKPSQLAGAGAG